MTFLNLQIQSYKNKTHQCKELKSVAAVVGGGVGAKMNFCLLFKKKNTQKKPNPQTYEEPDPIHK